MLVRDEVVGVVRSGAVEPEAADRPAFERLAGDDAIRAVGVTMRLAKQRLDVRLLETAALAAWRRDACGVVDRKLVRA